MFGKIIKNLLFFLLTIILLIIVFRNNILKFFIENYAGKALKAECKLKNANLWLNLLSLDELIVKTVDYDLAAKNITIKFKAQKEKPFFYINGVNLSGVTLNVKSLKNPKNISGKKENVMSAPVFAKPVTLDLKNINVVVKDKFLAVNSNFSVIAEIGQAVISIKDASIIDLDIRSRDFEMTNLRLKKFRNNGYLIKIPSIRIKDKKFLDFFIPVKTGVNQLLFPRAKNPFLGPEAFVSARYDFRRYDSFCFAAKFQDASFEKIADIFASEETAFKGRFNGSLKTCISAFKIREIEADFTNNGNGFINIKKESSFAFLKSYLDAPSYNALIDNFKNYEYNIGIIKVRKEADALSLNLDFTSDTMGRRNIIVNFHGILGNDK